MINVPSLSAYEEIENSRAHVYNHFDNQINILTEKCVTSNNNDNRSDLYKNVIATLYV